MKVESKLLKGMLAMLGTSEYRDIHKHIYFDDEQKVVFAFSPYNGVFIRFGEEPVDFASLNPKAVPIKSVKMAVASGDKFIELNDWADEFVLKNEYVKAFGRMLSDTACEISPEYQIDIKNIAKLTKVMDLAKSDDVTSKHKYAYNFKYTKQNLLVFTSRSQAVCVDAVCSLIYA